MTRFEVVYEKEGTCEICLATITLRRGDELDEVAFVSTPAGLVCEECVEGMYDAMNAL